MNSGKYSWATVIKDQGVAVVTICREERLNALPPAAHYEFSDIFDTLASDPSVRVIILTGKGEKAFCAGYDLRSESDSDGIDIGPSGFAGLTLREYYPLPVIAAVNGVALGGGFETALACDLIIASESARFALPEPRVGLAALGGGIQRLSRTIGLKRALGMILTGRTVSASEGRDLGFVTDVVPDGALMESALEWARQIIACAPLAIRCSKQVAYRSLEQPSLMEALNLDHYPLAQKVLSSEDRLEGQRAFAEKQAPQWKGK